MALLVSAGLLFVIGILTLGWRGLRSEDEALPDLTPRR
jgi:hypothetical protein